MLVFFFCKSSKSFNAKSWISSRSINYGGIRIFFLLHFQVLFFLSLSVMIIILTYSLCLVGWCGSFRWVRGFLCGCNSILKWLCDYKLCFFVKLKMYWTCPRKCLEYTILYFCMNYCCVWDKQNVRVFLFVGLCFCYGLCDEMFMCKVMCVHVWECVGLLLLDGFG